MHAPEVDWSFMTAARRGGIGHDGWYACYREGYRMAERHDDAGFPHYPGSHGRTGLEAVAWRNGWKVYWG